MSLLQSTLWLGIAALYLGFAGVMGVLLRSARQRNEASARWLAAVHGILVLIPASLFILRPEIWPTPMALTVLGGGAATLSLGAFQPDWTPRQLWRPTFGQRYFGVAMALTALWSLLVAWQAPSAGPAILAATSIGAACASLAKAPQGA